MAISLSKLTDGKIPYETFSEFVNHEGDVNAKILTEEFLGFKIKDSRLQPMFDGGGKPMRKENGEQLFLPWTWPACLAHEIIHRAGRDNNMAGSNLSDLPIPFWSPVEAHLFSADGYVIAATRSNMTPNGIGKSYTIAAGFSDERDHSVKDAVAREMLEETGLVLDKLQARIVELPLVVNRLATRYRENMATHGSAPDIRDACCPILGRSIAVHSRLNADDLVRMIKLNEESVGIVAVRVDDMKKSVLHPNRPVRARFWRSEWLPKPRAGYGHLSPSFAQMRTSLTRLRSKTPSEDTRPPKGKRFKLMPERPISLSPKDDIIWGVMAEFYYKNIDAGAKLGLTNLPSRFPVRTSRYMRQPPMPMPRP